jgi:sn-glycerol 3-phosphate transport system permease protein
VQQVPLPWLPGGHFADNVATAWTKAGFARLFVNSFIVAAGITLGKIAVSLLSAFAITYFRFRFRMTAFWLIFVSLMLPVEVRISPTYESVANAALPLQWLVDLFGVSSLVSAIAGHTVDVKLEWNMVNTYPGLILPLIASASATFLFRQFFLTIPGELVEAARIDSAGPFRFMRDILLPLSRTNIAALFVILFIYGWTQYLWPLLVTNDARMTTIIIGLRKMVDFADAATPWNFVMVTAILAIIPPVLVVVLMQRWFVKGLVETEK